MGQSRIIEVAYSEFRSILEFAIKQKKKIDPTQKEAWKAYVKAHNVPEAGFRVRANAKTLSGKTDAVIIDGTGEYDGYYLYSTDEQISLKFEPASD